MTEEEYLELEERSEECHDYVDGTLRYNGRSEEHNFVVKNFVLKLAVIAREKGCRRLP